MTDDSMAVMCQKMVSVLAIIRKLDEYMRDGTKWNENEMIAHTRFSIGCIKEIVPKFFELQLADNQQRNATIENLKVSELGSESLVQTSAGRIRFRLLKAFVDCHQRDLIHSEICVWITLLRDARDGVANISQKSLAERIGIDVRSIRRAVGALVKKKLLTIIYQGGRNRGFTKYRVHLPSSS